MFYLFIILLTGISFSIFPFFKLNMWVAHGLFVQSMVAGMYATSLIQPGNLVKIKNIPLALLMIWISLFTFTLLYSGLVKQSINLNFIWPYLSFLTGLIFYNLTVQYMNHEWIEKIFIFLKYTVTITLLVCVLQQFGLSQFFQLLPRPVTEGGAFNNNIVTGFMGNGTHLSGFLGSVVALYLYSGKREDYLTLVLMFLVFMFTGTTLNDPSIAGFIVAIVCFLYFFRTNKWILLGLISVCLLGAFSAWVISDGQFFSFNGRLKIWAIYGQLFKFQSVTGQGLGSVQIISDYTTAKTAKHMHMEYFHYLFEIGIIGLVIIIAMIKKFFDYSHENKLELALKTCVLGFLVNCCFAFPSHLWLPAMWVIFFYGSFMALKNKELTDV